MINRSNNRIEYLDISKAIAIILVIIGHAIQFSNGLAYRMSESFYYNLAFKIIYSFHMPLFMLITGYFTWGSYKKHGGRKLLINRIKDLLPPILFWGTILCLLDLLSHEYSISKMLGNYSGTLWFFISIILCTACITICEKSRYSLLLYLLILVAAHLTPGLQLHKFMYTFFIAGFLIAKHAIPILPDNSRKYRTITVISIFVWLFCLSVFNDNTYIYRSGVTLLQPWAILSFGKQIEVVIIRYIAGFAGSFAIIGFSRWFYETGMPSKLILNIGKITKEIYIIQMIAFTRLVSPVLSNYQWSLTRTIIVSMVMLIFCVCLTSFLKRFRRLNRIIV